MSSKNWLSSLLFAPPSHHEPLSNLDRRDGRTEPPAKVIAARKTDDAAAAKRARTGNTGNVL